MPAGVESCGTLTGQKPGRLDWVPAGRESVEPKQQPSPAWACPPWYAGQAGRWHGPCPDARKRRRGHIHPPSRKADMHAARRYRVPRDAEYATPHTGLTSCARTRSRPRLRRTAKTPPDGSDGPTPSGGILVLQRGEDVKGRPDDASWSGRVFVPPDREVRIPIKARAGRSRYRTTPKTPGRLAGSAALNHHRPSAHRHQVPPR